MSVLKPERHMLEDGVDQPVALCGKQFRAHLTGALYWPARHTLIVADLHFEKGSSFARHGQLLPPYDTRETLRRLATVIDHYDPDTVIALGDSVHDGEAADRMPAQDFEYLHVLQDDRDWIWITGNHDQKLDDRFGGTVCGGLTIDGITLRHAPSNAAITHEIAAHMHPAARLVMHGTALRRPCFVGNGRRLVLPAFGAFTGGLNILDSAFDPLFGSEGVLVWMLGQEGVYPVAPRLLKPD